jgi:hypothetical protein
MVCVQFAVRRLRDPLRIHPPRTTACCHPERLGRCERRGAARRASRPPSSCSASTSGWRSRYAFVASDPPACLRRGSRSDAVPIVPAALLLDRRRHWRLASQRNGCSRRRARAACGGKVPPGARTPRRGCALRLPAHGSALRSFHPTLLRGLGENAATSKAPQCHPRGPQRFSRRLTAREEWSTSVRPHHGAIEYGSLSTSLRVVRTPVAVQGASGSIGVHFFIARREPFCLAAGGQIF